MQEKPNLTDGPPPARRSWWVGAEPQAFTKTAKDNVRPSGHGTLDSVSQRDWMPTSKASKFRGHK